MWKKTWNTHGSKLILYSSIVAVNTSFDPKAMPTYLIIERKRETIKNNNKKKTVNCIT